MCGILGIFQPGNRAQISKDMPFLTKMLDHRGPDASGIKSLHNTFFGHSRLSILGLEESLAAQPVQVENCLLTFNGEIYNFRELHKNLENDGILCSNKSDTEILFRCLRHWGVEKTLRRIDGMFAFAFYDGGCRTLYLARDCLGEKPLYWTQKNGSFAFASEIKVLLASGLASPAPNLAHIDDYFHSGLINGTQTMFRDVKELSPGSFLVISEEQLQPVIDKFWSLEDSDSELSAKSMDSWGENLLEQLDQAVASRSVSDVPIGVLLSGGIDSNTIAERIISTDKQAPPFFFAESNDPATSERDDVDAFLNHMGAGQSANQLKLFTAKPNIDSFIDDHARLTWHFDEPLVFTNSISLSAICQKAQDQNIKVLLSGEGSDEILYGYDRFTRTAEQLSEVTDQNTIFRAVYLGGGEHNADLVDQLCAGKAAGKQQTEPWLWLQKYGRELPLPNLQLLFSQKFRLLSLLHRQDRVGMSHGVECRIPFLKPNLVKWINRLPFSAKYDAQTSRTKYLLRHIMKDRLPDRILTKPKDGFPSGIESWVRNGQSRSLIEGLIFDPDGFLNTYLDGGLAQKILANYFSGETRYEFLIWRFLNLEIWHRLFREGNSIKQGNDAYFKVFGALPAS